MRIDRLAQELRCCLCFETFDDPHSLPCQHTFCRECIMGYFKQQTRQQQSCPLCKAPTWRRQVSQNHTLAAIVRAFMDVTGGGAPSPVAQTTRPQASRSDQSELPPAPTTPPAPRASPSAEDEDDEVASPVY